MFSLQFIFVFYFVKYTPITMGDYEYPGWGEAMGFMISLSSMIWVPGYMIYYFFATPGTWREVLRLGTTPIIVPRAEAVQAQKSKELKEIKVVMDEEVKEKLLGAIKKEEPISSSSSDDLPVTEARIPHSPDCPNGLQPGTSSLQ